MKKILLAFSLLTIVAVCGTLEEDEKSCNNNNLQSCANLINTYKEPDKLSELMFKVYNILLKECKEGKQKSCDIMNSSNGIPAFVADDIFSGMTQNLLLIKKFEKNEDGLFKAMQGEMPKLLSSMRYGGKISGSFISYTTKILDKEAEVRVFLTKKSQIVYAIIIEWNKFSMGEGGDTRSAIIKSLNNKYGEEEMFFNSKEVTESFVAASIWKPNKRAEITCFAGVTEQMGIRTVLTYIDTYYLEINKKESKPATKTDKL